MVVKKIKKNSVKYHLLSAQDLLTKFEKLSIGAMVMRCERYNV